MCPKKLAYKYVAVDKDNVELEHEEIDDLTMKRKYITPRCLWTSLFTCLLVTCYYVPSMSLTFYQRWLLQVYSNLVNVNSSVDNIFTEIQISMDNGVITYGSEIFSCIVNQGCEHEAAKGGKSNYIMDRILKSCRSSRIFQWH